MPTPIDWTRWGTIKRTIEECLADGFSPPRVGGGRGAVLSEAARRLANIGIELDESTVAGWVRTQERRAARGKENSLPDWSIFRSLPAARTTAGSRVRRRWLLSAAQDDTPVHERFFANLRAFAAYLGAEIVIAPFTYNKKIFSDHETRNGLFAPELHDFLRYDSYELNERTVFCAEMNTLPTAVRPLSGLHSYTRGRTGIFPHAKIALESIPSMQGAPVPIVMTTGCVTHENYIQKKAGLKAAFHHCIGATIVEEDEDGDTFCRQLNATSDGSFQDLDLVVRNGTVIAGQRIEAITWGDIHRRKLNKEVALTSWGFDTTFNATIIGDSMLDVLRPRYQFFHDVLDFESRNHHEEGNPHQRFALHVRGRESLGDEIAEAAQFLRQTEREWCRSVVVESNHDLWIEGWLQKSDYRKDPINALFFLRAQLAAYEARERGDEDFSIFRHVMRQCDAGALANVEFSPENGSFVICHEHGGGIECGSHGHLGPNGARGSSASLTRISVKMNKGHDHTASIIDGVYSAGVSGDLFMGYNKGPSAWSHSHIVTYPNGKRTIVTLRNGKWRA